MPEKLKKHEARYSNAALDVAKLVMAVLVVVIHSSIDVGIFAPVLRTAVPFFFLCSSYFLFLKIGKAEDRGSKRKILKKFVKRNVILYLFWLAVQLPIITKGWWGMRGVELLKAAANLIHRVFFGNTFGASWYISAMVIGCCLIYFLSKWFSNRILLILGAGAYIFCLLSSSYNGLVRESMIMNYAIYACTKLILSVVNSIPAGILWIVLGKCLAEKPYGMKKWYYWMFALGLIGLLLENVLVTELGWLHLDDCYIMLIPTCFGLFQILRNTLWGWSGSVKLRNMSTIIYVTHGSILTIIWSAFSNDLLRFAVVLLIAGGLSWLIFWLERYKPFAWLRYAH